MYNKNDILLKLNNENYYIDRKTLISFIEMWNIDAVYEDESKEEYYDDYAIERIKKGINLKAQGFSDEQIILPETALAEEENGENKSRARHILGSLPTVTAVFGLTIANQVIKELSKGK